MTRVSLLLLLLAASGCQSIVGIDEFSRGSGGSGAAGQGPGAAGQGGGAAGDAGAAGGGGATASPCDDGAPRATEKGPSMRGVRTPLGACIWIDESEVTVGQYQSFLDASPAVAVQSPACVKANTTFTPDSACLADPTSASEAGFPRTCIDECDAEAYCSWSGKELCGSYRKAGTSAADLEKDAFYLACAGPSEQRLFPYEGDFDPSKCNGLDKPGNGCPGACKPLAAGAQTQCRTPEGVLDLSGNVAEWTSTCTGTSGIGDECGIRGGWFASKSTDLQCSAVNGNLLRTDSKPYVGFRCCASRPPPYVTGLDPISAKVGKPTTFTLTGGSLPETTRLFIPACTLETTTIGTASSRSLTCTPQQAATVVAEVKDAQMGKLLKTFAVTFD